MSGYTTLVSSQSVVQPTELPVLDPPLSRTILDERQEKPRPSQSDKIHGSEDKNKKREAP